MPQLDPDDFYQRLPRRSRLHLWWYRRAKTYLSILAVTLILATTAVLITFLPRVEQRNVAGTVRCLSGRAVVGVYVHDAHPRSGGWAKTTTNGADHAIARYQRDDVLGTTHSLSVGCGGNPKKWATVLDTPAVTGEYHDFLCFDHTDSKSGTCTAQLMGTPPGESTSRNALEFTSNQPRPTHPDTRS